MGGGGEAVCWFPATVYCIRASLARNALAPVLCPPVKRGLEECQLSAQTGQHALSVKDQRHRVWLCSLIVARQPCHHGAEAAKDHCT